MKNEQIIPDFDYEGTTFGTVGYANRALTAEDKLLLELYDLHEYNQPKPGDIISLTYYGSNDEYFLFDGNLKDFVRVDNKPTEARLIATLEVGESVDVIITEVFEKNFLIKGSVAQIYTNKVHEHLATSEIDEYVMGYIKDMSPAGFSVVFNYMGVDLNGFMPNTLAGINRLIAPEAIVGTSMELGIESFSSDEGTYIVSRRKYLQTMIPDAVSRLTNDELMTGVVTGSTDFGVFVEFNKCLTGMIHKSNLSPDYNISDIKPGVNIEFYIKEVYKNKIFLTQVLKITLWDTITPGQKLSGIVKDDNKIGTLVILDGETTGLITNEDVSKSAKKLQAGQTVKVKVQTVDRLTRKITLSIV